MIDLLNVLPKSVSIPLATLALGGGAVYGLEHRYMTVADFTKSYVLILKREIRDLRKEAAAASGREKEILEEELQRLIDELCIEHPDDAYCR